MRQRILCGLAAAFTLVAIACDSVTPVAPEGTVLTVSVSPSFIPLTGTALVTALVREGSGQPVNPGVQVFFSTTLGTIEQMAETDVNGVATATLRGDGRPGEAIVTVTTGAAISQESSPIQIGAFAALISLQVSPTVVLEDGGTLDLLALVRDDRGSLLRSAVVNFGSEFGILNSGGAGIATDQNGEARDTLSVSPADVITAGDAFLVTATTGGSDGLLVESTFTVSVTRLEPIASFTFSLLGNLRVSVNNTSTGAEPLRFRWDCDDNGTIEDTARNTVCTYLAPGNKTIRLTVTNDFGSDNAVTTLNVPN